MSIGYFHVRGGAAQRTNGCVLRPTSRGRRMTFPTLKRICWLLQLDHATLNYRRLTMPGNKEPNSVARGDTKPTDFKLNWQKTPLRRIHLVLPSTKINPLEIMGIMTFFLTLSSSLGSNKILLYSPTFLGIIEAASPIFAYFSKFQRQCPKIQVRKHATGLWYYLHSNSAFLLPKCAPTVF